MAAPHRAAILFFMPRSPLPARPPRRVLACVLLTLCALTAHADVLFQFGPSADYTAPLDPAGGTIALTSGNLPMRNPSGGAQNGGWRAFSGGPLTPAAPYAGPDLYGGFSVSYPERTGTAPTLFVGYGTTSSTATSGTYYQTGLRHDRPFNHLSPTAADALVLNTGYSGNASASGTLRAEVGFLVGARFDTPAVVSDLATDVRLPAGSSARPVLRQGSAYYVADTALPVTTATGQHLAWSAADLLATTWSLYDPVKPAPGATPGVYYGINYTPASPRLLADLANVSFAGVLLTRFVNASAFASSSFAEMQFASLRVEGSPGPVLDGVWQRIGLPPAGANSINPSGARQVFAVQIDPAQNLLYAGNRFVGSGTGSVLRSADEGLTWQAVGVGPGESWNLAGSGPNEEGFRLHPLRPDTWLFGSENRGIYATFDAGATLQNVIPGWVDGGIGHGFEIQFHPTNPDRIWVAGGVGVFRSDDGGHTWTRLSTGLPNSQTQALRVDPANPDRLYAGQIWTTGGLFRSDNAGDSWQRIETGIGEPGQRITPTGYYFVSTFQIELHPARPGELYALTAKGLYRSTNYGDTWAPHAFIGGNNVGTSEQAWRALLAAAHNLGYDPASGNLSSTDPLSIPFSRFLRPTGDASDPWSGYRELTEAQLAALAANIVAEVRARGPFKSLADFVNRRLANDATGLKGALQAAIDTTDLDPAATRRLNDRAPYDQHPVGNGPGGDSSLDLAAYRGTEDAVARLPVSSRNAFGPGHLTQADLLSRIGSTLSARSDTFVIRVYGETRNPTLGDEPVARAWAEAVVQRMPEYVEDATPPQNSPAAGSDSERFGRRFTVVSFRWLSPEDI